MRQVSIAEAGHSAVAALAMAANWDVPEVRTAFAGGFRATCRVENWIDEWCFRNGFAWQRIHARHKLGSRRLRDPWPPVPFAPSHICQVVATGCVHFVAMADCGVVYDPADHDRYDLSHPDYSEIIFVMGLWPVGDDA